MEGLVLWPITSQKLGIQWGVVFRLMSWGAINKGGVYKRYLFRFSGGLCGDFTPCSLGMAKNEWISRQNKRQTVANNVFRYCVAIVGRVTHAFCCKEAAKVSVYSVTLPWSFRRLVRYIINKIDGPAAWTISVTLPSDEYFIKKRRRWPVNKEYPSQHGK